MSVHPFGKRLLGLLRYADVLQHVVRPDRVSNGVVARYQPLQVEGAKYDVLRLRAVRLDAQDVKSSGGIAFERGIPELLLGQFL